MRRGESWWLSIGLGLPSPYVAAEKGYIDDVIKPAETRPKLITALEMLVDKRESRPPRKHGNMPL